MSADAPPVPPTGASTRKDRMTTRFARLCTAVAAVAALASSALADEGLKWVWTKGQSINYKNSTDANVDLITPQGPMKQTVSMTMVMNLAVKEVAEDGTATIETKYTSAKIDMEVPMMGKMSYDSSSKENDENNPMSAIGQALNKSFTMVVEPSGKIRSVKGLADLMGDLGQMGPMFSEEAMKANLEQSFYVLPDKPAAKGDTWTRTSEQEPLKMENVYTLNSVSGNSAEIGVDVKVSLSTDEVMGMKVTLDEGKGKGTITFDNGVLKRSEGTANFSIKLSSPQGEVTQKAVTKTTVEKVD